MENHTAKHFVLQLGSLVSLYLSLSFLLVLLFGVINIKFPDEIFDYYQVNAAQESVRIGFAMLVVFFPTYLYLTRTVNKIRRKDSTSTYLSLTKWLVYLSLLIGGGALLGDLVTVIMTFLNGEITQRFILKAGAVFVVVGAAFHYYLLDARGFWLKHEDKSVLFAYGAIAVVVVSLAFGLMSIKSPTEVREMKIDQQQISDLQTIQWQVQDYTVTHGQVPQSLEDITTMRLPTAPEGRQAYRYKPTEKGFELCATFAYSSSEDANSMSYPAMPVTEKMYIQNPDNWEHKEGDVCFERVINKDNVMNEIAPVPMMKI